MKDEQIETQVDKIAVPLWVIAVLLGFLLISFLCDGIANAESAIVSFNDAEQLAAISDSIVGVIDSAFTTSDSCLEGYTKSYFYGNSQSDGYVYYFRWTVNCRELVSRTVETHARWKRCPTDKDSWKRIPGTVIITWKEVKR